MSNKNSISYRRVGDFLIQNLTSPPKEANIKFGKLGMLYKSHLEKRNKPFFNSPLIKGKLYQHCAEVESQANEMFDMLIEQMKLTENITKELKEHNQWELVQRMGNIEQRAREGVQPN